ncbi:MAG: hypothetical protein ACF8OB_12955 [Phycisphaeraceae bacterium JB051]
MFHLAESLTNVDAKVDIVNLFSFGEAAMSYLIHFGTVAAAIAGTLVTAWLAMMLVERLTRP